MTEAQLCNEWMAFLSKESLPNEWDAQSAILSDLTDDQRKYVTDFIMRWEEEVE